LSYTTESGRQQILTEAAAAAAELGTALAILGDAYEQLDDNSADRVEQVAFRPLQAAYGQLKRTLAEFAARYQLAGRTFETTDSGLPADVRVLLERVADAAQAADDTLASLQDSLLPVEVGDEALRAGLARTRTLIAPVPAACDELIRTIGR
jgi:hypothetical protein